MSIDSRGDGEAMVDVRLQMKERQVQLLEALAEDGGPCDDPNDALDYIIDEYEGLSLREPLKAD